MVTTYKQPLGEVTLELERQTAGINEVSKLLSLDATIAFRSNAYIWTMECVANGNLYTWQQSLNG